MSSVPSRCKMSGEVSTRPLPMFAPGELETLFLEDYATGPSQHGSMLAWSLIMAEQVDIAFADHDAYGEGWFVIPCRHVTTPAKARQIRLPSGKIDSSDRLRLAVAEIQCSRRLTDITMNELTQPLDCSHLGAFVGDFSVGNAGECRIHQMIEMDFSEEPEWSLVKHAARKAVKRFYGLEDADSGIPEQ